MTEKVVGVIGGMGPEATVDLMQRVIAATPADDDIDHIRMIVDNNPKVPSRIKALLDKTGESPGPCMAEMGRSLQHYGADFLVIPCNTAHHYYQQVADAVDIPVLNMIRLTVARAGEQYPDLKRIGVLASTAVQQVGLYDQQCRAQHKQALFPQVQAQSQLMDAIRAVKAGRQDTQTIQAYNDAAADLQQQGAECLVIACTELSVLAKALNSKLPVYDASQVLAEQIVQQAKGSS